MTALRTSLISLVLLAAGIGTLAGITGGFAAYTSETARRIAVRKHPPVVPSVPLQTASGEHIDFNALRGRWLLVEFIYTRCMTYCSAQGSEFARIQRQLDQLIALNKVMLLSISFDPARDDPAALTRYQRTHRSHGEGWVAARPLDQSGLGTLMNVFGVVAVPDGLGGFVHNVAIHVVNPDGKLIEILDWDDTDGAVRYLTQRLTP